MAGLKSFRRRWTGWGCALALATGASQGAPVSPEDGLLLYAPFDGSASAAYARGDGTPTTAIPPEFRPGLRGQALVIGGQPEDSTGIVDDLPAHAEKRGKNAEFASDQNLDVRQGTVSFWLKPLDWMGSDGGFNVFFRTQAGRRNFFMLYKFFRAQRLRMIIGEDPTWTSTEGRIGHWSPEHWRHLAVTWSPEEQRLFIDGHLEQVLRRRYPLENIEPVEPISVGPGGSWARGFIGHSLVDEFRIHDRPLSQQEIAALYRLDADRALLDGGHVTVGRCTPVLDGRTEPFEYAFEGTGLSDLLGTVARRQANYLLGYDAEFLYVAARTRSGVPAEAEPVDGMTMPELSLFLVTEPGKGPLQHLVFRSGEHVRGGDDSDREPAGLEDVRVAESRSGNDWTLEAAIPFRTLGVASPADGAVWRFNLAWHWSATETSSAAPVVGTPADRGKFLELRFRAGAPRLRLADLYDMERHCSNFDLAARSEDPAESVDYLLFRDNFRARSEGLQASRGALLAEGVPQPVKPGGLLQERENQELRILEVRDGLETVLYRARFLLRDERKPLAVHFLYTLDRRRLSVAAERRAAGALQVRFLKPDGAEAWRARQPIPEAATFFDAVFDLDFERLTPGEYLVKVDHVAPGGMETESWQQEYLIPGPEHSAFQPYTDPEADRVPAPWTPVEVSAQRAAGRGQEAGGRGRIEVSTWGRSYGFGAGILCDSLVSQGEELLAAPALLRLDGEALEAVEPVETLLEDASDLKAVLLRRAHLGRLRVESRLTTHFDGYCEIELTLRPSAEGLSIETLALEFPLHGACATLVRDGKLAPFVGSKSGALGDAWHQRLIDAPMLWIGNDRIGFNWVASSLERWHSLHNDRNVEAERDGELVHLRFNLVDAPLLLEAPRTITFGFTLTPTRPLDRRILRRRENKDYASMAQPWAYFAVPEYDTVHREALFNALRRAEPGADQVFVYNGSGLFSPFHPTWAFFEQEWRAMGPSAAYGEWVGGHADPEIRKRVTYVSACRQSETFRNFLLHASGAFFERSAAKPLIPEATGFYFDAGVGASLCANAHHGCAPWKGLDGRTYGRMHIRETRETWLNVYRMVRRTGPKAVLYYHLGWPRAMPMMTFTDILCGGEGISGQIGRPDGSHNYYEFFTPELFRATFSPYLYGIKMVFIDHNLRLLREENPAAFAAFRFENPEHRRPVLHSYGYCLVHDVDVWDRYEQTLPLRRAIWAAQDALGWDEKVVFHPYWENDAVRRLGPETDRLLASAYTKDGRMLLVVLNDTDAEREVELALDLERLGMTPGGEGVDAFEPEKRYTLGRIWRGTVPPREFRMLLWQ